MARQRSFPHLPLVQDAAVQSSARLLWDRVGALHDGVGQEQTALAAGARAAGDIPALLERERLLLTYSGDGFRPGTGGPTAPADQLAIINNQYYERNGQPLLPIMCHYMEAFSRYTRNESQVADELSAIKAAGYTGIRFLDILNNQPFWTGREVNPINVNRGGISITKTSNYYGKLKDFLLLCESTGLLVNWSRGDLQPYSSSQREDHFSNVGTVAREVGINTIAVFEGVNEGFDNGISDIASLLPLLNIFSQQAGASMLRALTSPQTAEAVDVLADHSYGVPLAMAHGARGGNLAAKLGAIHAIRRDYWPGKLVWQDEPPGTATSGTTNQYEMDEQGLALMAVESLICDQAYSVMLKNAVKWNDTLSDDAGFYTVPAAVAMLPNDLMQWSHILGRENSGAELTSVDPSILGPAVDQRFNLEQGKIVAIVYPFVSLAAGGTDTRIRSVNRRWVGSAYKFISDSPYVEEFDTFDLEKDEEQTLDYDPEDVRGCLLLGSVG